MKQNFVKISCMIRKPFENKYIPMIAIASLILIAATLPVNAAIQATGLEIRGEVFDSGINVPDSIGCRPSCLASWNANNFAGFWYDLKDGKNSEELTIVSMSGDNRTIYMGGLLYKTTSQSVMYKVSANTGLIVENGLGGATGLAKDAETGSDGYSIVTGGKNFSKISWMAQEYIAINGKANKLAKLVFEHRSDDKKNLTVGDTWEMGDGYTLKAQSIDFNATPKRVEIILSKDGTKLYNKTVVQGQVYAYSMNFSGETDVPVFVTYVDSVFKEATSDLVRLKYSWLISNNATEIKPGDRFGAMMVIESGAATGTIVTRNEDRYLSLSQDSTTDIMGNLKFKVAGSTTPRFYPMVAITTPGFYEVRGEVFDPGINVPDATGSGLASWNANNFAAFWYDFKNGLMSEDMAISGISGRTIPSESLTYNATIRAVQFKVNSEKGRIVENGLDSTLAKDQVAASDGLTIVIGGGYYAKIGWQAQEYVALNGKPNKLAKLVFEQTPSDKKSLTIGDVWDIGDGYTLIAQSIDTSTSPRQVWLNLSKDGVKLDDKIVVQGQVYTYTKNSLAGEIDVPIFVTYVDSVFAGATTDLIQLKYTWVVSTNVTEIIPGDKYGLMEVMDDGSATRTIKLLNKNSAVSLSQNSVVDIMGSMKFRVADSSALRFYPMVEYEILPSSSSGGGGGGSGFQDTMIFEPKEWNLVSVPRTLVNPAVDVGLVNLSFDSNNIKWEYNATGTAWEHPLNILPLRGYWVYNNASAQISQKLNYRSMTGPMVPPSMKLRAGWNLIGHTSTQSMPVESALISINGKYSHLLSYSPVEGWKMYIVGNPNLQQFNSFEPGRGYWIFMIQDADYAAVEI